MLKPTVKTLLVQVIFYAMLAATLCAAYTIVEPGLLALGVKNVDMYPIIVIPLMISLTCIFPIICKLVDGRQNPLNSHEFVIFKLLSIAWITLLYFLVRAGGNFIITTSALGAIAIILVDTAFAYAPWYFVWSRSAEINIRSNTYRADMPYWRASSKDCTCEYCKDYRRVLNG